ncbi:hypothetical protein ABZW51_13480 [Streptomyces cellulosae]
MPWPTPWPTWPGQRRSAPRRTARRGTPTPARVVPARLGQQAAVPAHAGDQGNALFAARLRERLTAEPTAAFREGRRPAGFEDVPAELHAAYLAGALIAVVATWVADETPASAEETALAFWRLFRG